MSFKLIFNALSLRLLLQYKYLTFTVRCRVHTAARIQRYPPSWSGIANKKGSNSRLCTVWVQLHRPALFWPPVVGTLGLLLLSLFVFLLLFKYHTLRLWVSVSQAPETAGGLLLLTNSSCFNSVWHSWELANVYVYAGCYFKLPQWSSK